MMHDDYLGVPVRTSYTFNRNLPQPWPDVTAEFASFLPSSIMNATKYYPKCRRMYTFILPSISDVMMRRRRLQAAYDYISENRSRGLKLDWE